MKPYLIVRGASAALLSSLLGGCASVVDIADRHNDANLVQERVMNQQLLLNIVRAAHRQPLHFSNVPYVRLPLVNSAPWELSVPFGVVGSYTRNLLKTNLGAQVITVEVTPQTSQEFIQGITTPVNASLMDLYFRQGWPQSLILYLFLEELREMKSTTVRKPGEKDKVDTRVVRRLRNDPSDAEALKGFKQLVDELTGSCELVIKSGSGTLGPRLPAVWKTALDGMSETVSAGLMAASEAPKQEVAKPGEKKAEALSDWSLILPGGTSFQVVPRNPEDAEKSEACSPEGKGVPPSTSDRIPGENRDETKALAPSPMFNAMKNFSIITAPSPEALSAAREQLRGLSARPQSDDQRTTAPTTTHWVEFTLRSPDSMVYCLGEVMRQGAKQPAVTAPGDKQVPIFQVTSSTQLQGTPENAALWVDFWGRRYVIARPSVPPSTQAPDDRSMQTLGLVAQILQLKNKSTSAPRSAPPLRVEATP